MQLFKRARTFATVVCLILIFTSNIFAQSQPGEDQIGQLKTVIPPSPTAAALAKFGDWPVNLYTGTPSISVPLFTLSSRDINVPISLDYHASGIRVGEIASWVGLGWALNAGGVITRSVRGINDDDVSAGYFRLRSDYPDPENLNGIVPPSIWKPYRVGAANNSSDSEQDIYSLNALGHSYKLMFKADGTIVTMPYSQVKISVDNRANMKAWVVTLEDGTKLSFGHATDWSFWEVGTSNFGSGLNSYQTAWYLRTIESPLGEVVNFSYVRNAGSSSYDYARSQTDFIEYTLTAGGGLANCGNYTEGGKTVVSRVESSSVVLHSIENALERIEFVLGTDPRQDVNNSYPLGLIKRFSKISNRYLEEYDFDYSYSEAVTTGVVQTDTYTKFRLKLDRLTKIGSDGGAPMVWDFEYDNQRLPSRNSFAQDHWGYYNGAVSNTSLLPPMFKTLPIRDGNLQRSPYAGFMPPMHDMGGNRETDPTAIKAETLTRITYPTGGTSVFEFEANSIVSPKEVVTQVPLAIDRNITGGSYINEISLPFTISKGQYIWMRLESHISESIYHEFPRAEVSASVKDSIGNVVFSIGDNGQQYFALPNAGHYSFTVTTNVPQGVFELPVDIITINASLKYSVSTIQQQANKYIGGLRVKTITDNDGVPGSPNVVRAFVYEDPYIISPISDADYYTELSRSTKDPELGYICSFVKMVRSSNTRYSLGTIQGGTVGYGKVTTLYGLNGENGKSVSYFSNEEDHGIDLCAIFPFPPADNRDWRRGSLLVKLDYDASGNLLRRTSNLYGFESVSSLLCFKSGFGEAAPGCADQYNYCGVVTIFYNIGNEIVRHLQQRDVTYSYRAPNFVDSLETVTSFYYDNPSNLQATRTEATDSRGRTIKTLKRTALEKSDIQGSVGLSATASLAIDSMLVKNMIGVPIEMETYVDGGLVSKSVTNFFVNGTNKIVPTDVMIQNGSGPLEKRIEFVNYDANLNLIQQKKSDDINHSYMWSYGGRYPVAEITNAAQSDIAYTSFETTDKGGWNYSGSVASGSVTGSLCYNLASGNVSKTGIDATKKTTISFWADASVQVNGQSPTAKQTVNGWTLYIIEITGSTTATITGSAKIDELRLYPTGAQMVTYTYDPLVGLTSQASVSNQVTYYEYDEQNRLTLIKDENKNVLKYYRYNYQLR